MSRDRVNLDEIKRMVLLASDHSSELIAELDCDENTRETARQVHLAIWSLRWELGLTPTDQARESDDEEAAE